MPSNDERWLDAEAGPVVRPYALTQGRTRHTGESFDLVATVMATQAPITDPGSLAPEHMSVLQLARGAERHFGNGGAVRQTIIEMESGFLLTSAAGSGTCLAVIAEQAADLSLVAYEMAILVRRTGEHIRVNTRASALSGWG